MTYKIALNFEDGVTHVSSTARLAKRWPTPPPPEHQRPHRLPGRRL